MPRRARHWHWGRPQRKEEARQVLEERALHPRWTRRRRPLLRIVPANAALATSATRSSVVATSWASTPSCSLAPASRLRWVTGLPTGPFSPGEPSGPRSGWPPSPLDVTLCAIFLL